jgi:hypothetical protein
MAKHVIHVQQLRLKKNRISGEREPVLTVKRKHGGPATMAHQVVIRDEGGREVARVVYSPAKPLSCGAVCWVESSLPLELLDLEGTCHTCLNG